MHEDETIAEFKHYVDDYVETHNCFGINGHGERKPFVPYVALAAFWTREKITSVRCYDQFIPENSEDILNHYIIVFSILVLSWGPEKIGLFFQEEISDKHLPLLSVPETHRDSPSNVIFSEFINFQWKFYPMSFYQDPDSGPRPNRKNISPDIILPITQKEKINPKADENQDTAVLYKVTLHPDCTELSEPVVLKEYCQDDAESEKLYQNEWVIYSHLTGDSFNHIVKYYGSFQCLGRRTVVLEYAPGGTLLSFFKEREPPQTEQQRQKFWQNLFGLLEGLEAIDDCTRHHQHSNSTWQLRGTHQDIRPQNILVFGNPSDNDYGVPFKFADMGTAHLRKMKSKGIDTQAVDQYGNGMYSAPEAVHDGQGATNINHKSDVWSLGGIISEALIWSIWGEKGREEYQTQRIESTGRTRLRGGYHEGAFHDGESVLDIVEKWHTDAVLLTGGSAGPLSEAILGSMLVSSLERRGTATSVLKDSERVFKSLKTVDSTAQNFMTGESPGWPSFPLPHTRASGSGEAAQSPTQASRITSMKTNTITGYPLPPHHSLPTLTITPLALTSPRSEGFIPEYDERRATSSPDAYHDSHHYPPKQSTDNNSMGDPKGKAPYQGPPMIRDDGHWPSELPMHMPTSSFYSAPAHFHDDRQPGTSDQSGMNHLQSNLAASERRTEAFNSAFPQESQAASSSTSQQIPGGSGDPSRFRRVPSRPERNSSNQPSTGGSYSRGREEDGAESSRPSRKRTSTGPLITINDVWTKCLKGRTGGLGGVFKRTLDAEDPALKAFPTLRPVLRRLRGNGGRNQIFIIDDSRSMQHHQEQLARTCRVLSRLLKVGQVDPDEEFELYFASSHESIKAKNSTELQVAVEKHDFTNRRCEMYTILDEVVTRIIGDVQPVSIYVLTNGHWGNVEEPLDVCGVDRPIGRLAKHISAGGKQENWAIIQFIRFYKESSSPADQCGKKRLKWLDDDLQSALKLEVDIVDARRADGDVEQILLGAFSKEADESADSE